MRFLIIVLLLSFSGCSSQEKEIRIACEVQCKQCNELIVRCSGDRTDEHIKIE